MTRRNFRCTGVVSVCIFLVTSCHKPNSTVLGKDPEGSPQTILSVKTGGIPSPVTIQGVMIEKCPVAGCWFRLRDSTGVIKVDTKLAGFVVLDVPLQSRVAVTGKRTVGEGNEVTIEAAGVRY
jgi:uncharacterized protein YdeI (BOF family)